MYDGFLFMNDDIKFMKMALLEAKKAMLNDEVPIGAVLVKNGKILARAHNQKEQKDDVTAHAEMLVIRKASKKIKNWRLLDTTLYVTLEPCAMCASAIQQARISRIVYALEDYNNGAIDNGVRLYKQKSVNKPPLVASGILKDEASTMLRDFFKQKRTLAKDK